MDKNSKDQSGQTPCHEASSNGHLEVCRLFMECVTTHLPKQLCLKMDVEDGVRTPFQLAAWNGHLRVFNERLREEYEEI